MSDTARKNCHSCEHLEYEAGDEYGSGSGWCCEKRDPTTAAAEAKLLANLDSEAYRNRYKRCFEPIIRLSSAASAANLEGNKP